jgi:membrane protein implicated in regulation of membrane protease activity
MPDIKGKLDLGSRLVIVITLALFVAALFVKGFGHDLLLEAGVFLVSVKLIIMAARHSVSDRELRQRLDRLDATLGEVRERLRPNSRPGQGDASEPL